MGTAIGNPARGGDDRVDGGDHGRDHVGGFSGGDFGGGHHG